LYYEAFDEGLSGVGFIHVGRNCSRLSPAVPAIDPDVRATRFASATRYFSATRTKRPATVKKLAATKKAAKTVTVIFVVSSLDDPEVAVMYGLDSQPASQAKSGVLYIPSGEVIWRVGTIFVPSGEGVSIIASVKDPDALVGCAITANGKEIASNFGIASVLCTGIAK